MMVQAARSYGRKKGLLGSYVVGNAASLPFCDACFDGVAMLGAIIAHVPGRDGRVQAFRAAWRTLRPGGKLAMTTHNRRCHWKFRLYFACVNSFRRLGRRLMEERYDWTRCLAPLDSLYENLLAASV